MSYHLDNHVINLSAPAGNVFRIVGICAGFVKQVEGHAASQEFLREALGKTGDGELRKNLGGKWKYEDVLRACKKKTGVTFWSSQDLGLPEELYQISESPPEGYIYT